MKSRISILLTLLAIALAGSLPAGQILNRHKDVEADTNVPGLGPSVFLSDLPWEWATTGWVALADDNLPKLDTSFLNGVITIGNRSYDKGIGTYPLSEIVYHLDGKYQSFQAEVGVDGAVPEGRGSVVFKLFLDDALAYDSGVIQSGTEAQLMELSVEGIDRMKLVVEDSGDGSSLDYADWAEARLTPMGRQVAYTTNFSRQTREVAREERRQGRQQDWAAVRQRSGQEMEIVSRAMQEAQPPEGQATAVFDADSSLIVMANDRIALTLGYDGERHGLLDIIDLQSRTLVAYDTTPSLTTRDLSTLSISRHTEPQRRRRFRFRRVDDPALGTGVEVVVNYYVPGADVIISPRITIFDHHSYFTYRLELREVESDVAVRRFSYFDYQKGGYFVLGEQAGYITDYSLIRRAEVRDDSILRQEMIGLGKPIVLYDEAESRGMVMAVIDEVGDPARFSLRLDAGRVSGRLGFEHVVPEDVRATTLQTSPRLFFQVTRCASMGQATTQFRGVMAALYPPPPIPDWVKYQWGTWYAFGMGYDEDIVRQQIDYIASNLADLGPWSVLLDAGWYVAEGRPDSSFDQVDEEKFPSGLRALVDYAHSKGIKVVLYFSAPYLDDREREGNWLGLRGFIEEHPDWVIRLQSDSSGASYVYDFTNPGLVNYMRQLISDFFNVYDVDGIKIDGLGQAEGEQLSVEERDIFGDVNKIRMFTMDIYLLIQQEAARAGKDVYIESGWAIPTFANQYAHTFRYGDEFPGFENRYPQGGLLEHIDYATLQEAVIGQRPNMGMVWGGPESQRMIRSWFEAALAMGTQMTISTDLTRLTNRDLNALRSVLVHYNAFQGETHFVGIPFADSFATTTDGITYLGAVNRQREDREVSFRLSDYGLDPQQEYLMYDVSSARYSQIKGAFSANLDASSFRLFLLRDSAGVMWTNSSFQTESTYGSLKVEVSGPRGLAGSMQLHVPSSPVSVQLDGTELEQSPRLSVANSYWYDENTHVLRLRYRHNRPHTIEVDY